MRKLSASGERSAGDGRAVHWIECEDFGVGSIEKAILLTAVNIL